MFKKEYTFYGSHAEKVNKLTADFDEFPNSRIFRRNVDVLIFAPIVGFLFSKRAPLDKSISTTTKIFPEQMINEDLSIKFGYQTVTLLDKKSKLSKKKRIEKAFRFIGQEDAEEQLDRFNEYILGGVDILFAKIIEPSTLPSDYINHLFDFMEDFNEKYNREISEDEIKELLALARE